MLTAEEDEYSDDQDMGYVRQQVRDQHKFVASEVDLSDNDSSARGASLYHRAQSYKSSDQARHSCMKGRRLARHSRVCECCGSAPRRCLSIWGGKLKRLSLRAGWCCGLVWG